MSTEREYAAAIGHHHQKTEIFQKWIHLQRP
jgi:hypothetical protein